MVPFEFQPRTRVVFGPGCVERIGAAARELKVQRVLLVADPGLVAAGHVAAVRRSLDAASVAVFPFHDVGENPDKWVIQIGLSQFRSLHQVQWNLVMAATILVMLPVIVLFFLAQRAFVEGVTLTGVKG